MANHASAKKRTRSSLRKRTYNNLVKGQIKTLEKKARTLLKKDKNAAKTELKKLLSALDKASQKGSFHPNKAARKKSRISRLFNS